MHPDNRGKRIPWVAAFLSLVLPGLGQLYCGAFVRCLVFIILSSGAGMLGVLALIPRLQLPGAALGLIGGLALLVYIVGVVDAFRLARRTRADYLLKDYNRWYAYVLLGVAVSAGHLFAILHVRDRLIAPFRAASASMYPTIWAGDQVIADRNAYVVEDPAPGEVVIFLNPENRGQVFLKRVVAVAGDTVEIHDGIVVVNGEPLAREPAPAPAERPPQVKDAGSCYFELNRGARYRVYFSDANPRQRDLAKITVPRNECFVLGDSRDESLDSRSFGPIPLSSVTGRVGFIYAPLARLGSLK